MVVIARRPLGDKARHAERHRIGFCFSYPGCTSLCRKSILNTGASLAMPDCGSRTVWRSRVQAVTEARRQLAGIVATKEFVRGLDADRESRWSVPRKSYRKTPTCVRKERLEYTSSAGVVCKIAERGTNCRECNFGGFETMHLKSDLR